jgi:crossover junction endodeoxyribonuclease RuvC
VAEVGEAARLEQPPGASFGAEVGVLRILGIDPGSRTTGFGLVQSDGRRHQRLASGCIRARRDSHAGALASIHAELAARLRDWSPHVVAVEAVFTCRNARSALVLGQARGAALAACGLAGIRVAEYAPAEIKSAVAGYGAADKSQMKRMVALLLGLALEPGADEADALASALCHAQTARLRSAVNRSLEGERRAARLRARVGGRP